jgi:hypothetical protein
VPAEERLVVAHELAREEPHAELALEHRVDEQERVPVRQQALDVRDGGRRDRVPALRART